jgi:hypothetical protein
LDNERDKDSRGRRPTGEKHGRNTMPENTARGSGHGMAHLSDGDVVEIRKMEITGFSRQQIASRFNVGKSNIGMIVRRVTWKHIP